MWVYFTLPNVGIIMMYIPMHVYVGGDILPSGHAHILHHLTTVAMVTFISLSRSSAPYLTLESESLDNWR